ncbi:MAG: transcription antitermination factor NusB [Rhodospirillaceae bacterium]|nr:transcription antitermination factor NusB [Rhodospirillaceae bacterium]
MTAPSDLSKADLHERSAARLAAVQALYQIEASQNPPEQIIKDFLIGKVGGLAVTEDADTAQESIVALATLDSELFINLVRGVQTRGPEIDEIIKGALSPEWPWERLEMTVRAILRCGVAELLVRTDIPGGATVSEFIEVAHAFYAGPEPRMVNAVLDRVAKILGRGRASTP